MAVPLALLAGMATAGIQAHSQNQREKRSYQNQLALMKEQRDNQQYLDNHGANLQYDLWKKTNYSAQMEEMRKAGLNPSLMYGMGGAGGATTGSQGGGSAQGGQAPQPQQLDIAGAMQVGLMKAQKDNIEADTANKKADAEKKSGIDTEVAKGTLAQLIANTTETEAKTKLLEIQTDISDIERYWKPQMISAELSHIIAKTQESHTQNYIDQQSADAIIAEAKSRAIGQTITNALNNAKINLTKEETSKIKTELEQKWIQLGQTDRQLDINKFEQMIKRDYPSLMQMGGAVINDLYRELSKIEGVLRGKGEATIDRYK